MTPLQLIIGIILLLITSVIFHELGHVLLLSHYNKGKNKEKIGFRFERGVIIVGKPEHYNDLTNPQLFKVYVSGAFLGYVPFIYYFDSIYYHPLLFILYTGIYFIFMIFKTEDFKNIKRLLKKECILEPANTAKETSKPTASSAESV